jgi:photosystem II stability/assembly factor-like uncharacterized protein
VKALSSRFIHLTVFAIAACAGLAIAPAPRAAAPAVRPRPEDAFPRDWVKALSWRCIGPASMGGRIVALSVFEADPSTYWVATASGGLLKTTNNGTTFEHQFDREATVSLGDVCVAPSNRNIVWVGTGENNPRNSVSYGDGVYKSVDGGKTWKNMGLRKTYQIGKVIVHPENPDIVYVGALGRLYGPNEDRGVFKTIDGGKTWEKILFVDNHTGVIDMRMDPTDPDTLLAATWQRQRDGFDSHAGALAGINPFIKHNPPLEEGYDGYDPSKKWGTGGGIYKTTDGKTFRKLTKGLPTVAMGRIGLDFYRKDPKVVFAVIDSEKIGTGLLPTYLGVSGAAGKEGVRLTAITPNGPAAKAGLKVGDIVTAADKKPIKNDQQLAEIIRGKKVGDGLVLAIIRDKKPSEVTAVLAERVEPDPPPRLGIQAEQVPGGLKVTQVMPGGPGGQAGLQVGDVIEALEKTKTVSLKALTDALAATKPGAKVSLTVLRGKESKTIVAALPKRQRRRATRHYSFWYGGQRENVQVTQGPEGFQTGGVYKSVDGGESWTRINSVNPRPMYFSQIRVDPSDDKILYVLGISMYRSKDGGKTFRMEGDRGVHPDQHALWIDPRDGRHMIIGTDGGFYATYDRGAHWDYLNTSAIGQFYHVSIDSRKPYRVYGGMQDNGSWGGPSRSLDGRGPRNSDWIMVNGGDGFVCRVDAVDPDIVYYESQDGHIGRANLKTGQRAYLRPRTGMMQTPYRFNWNAPFILSTHNPRIFYSAGNYVFRSLKRGDDLRRISPELTRNSKGSATALAESPRNPDVLWAGTDDGNLWVTRDGGTKWVNVADNVKLPGRRWVATIEPSRFFDGRAYVAFDAHRSNDDNPYIYVTEDFGQSWKSLRGNLPMGSTRVLREDLENPEVLYLGTEFAVWASVNRGQGWTKINNNLPTVAVHELAQHPTTGDMVAATHGRSLWVVDVTPLRQMRRNTLHNAVTLFQPTPAVRWRSEPLRGTIYGSGSRGYAGENPPQGAQIYYALTHKPKKMKLTVQNFNGKPVATLAAPATPGLHRITWSLGGNDPDARRGGRRFDGRLGPGQYRVVLEVDGKTYTQGLRIEADPVLQESIIATDSGTPPKKRPPGPEDF